MTATRNLARLNEEAFERRGDYESLLFEGRWHRSSELFERACRLAGGLTELGIAPGERVVVSMANCPEVSIVYNALWRAGAVVTPATFLLCAADLRHVIADSEASAVITTPDLLEKVREAVDGLEFVRHVTSTETSGENGVLSLGSLQEAAPLAPQAAAEIERRIPSATVRQGYGLTETAALIATNPAGRERPGSVGVPIPGAAVRIVDEMGLELPVGEVGEICCRSPAVMRGYWRSERATADTIRGGWLHTGDVGYVDEEGYLFIVDRKKDVIIRGGFNVYPRDVEDALLEHPAVTGAGVVGRPDERHGEEVVAFVSLSEPDAVSAEELVEWARRRIAGYKYPREVHILDAMPLTAVGKLDRKALRARVSLPAA